MVRRKRETPIEPIFREVTGPDMNRLERRILLRKPPIKRELH
jgi:hypothetical protein